METYKTILIVDDHTLFRNGLKLLLQHYLSNCEIIESKNGREAVLRCSQSVPDVILMDINMPEMNGIEATKKIIQLKPNACIIALTMHGDESYYYQMIDAGVKGFLVKNSNPDEVITAIKQVCQGKHYFSQEVMYSMIKNLNKTEPSTPEIMLTSREKEVLIMICEGLSNQEIGDKLFISKRTVDNHRASLLEKTESKNTAQLVIFAIKSGFYQV